MRFRTLTIAVAALGSTMGAISAPATAAPAPAPAVALAQSSSPAATAGNRLGATPAATQIDFSVGLQLRDPAGAVALQRAVSDPAGADYRHFLTPAEWESRFSPAQSTVDAVTSWLRSAGISVDAVTPDRLTVQASASAATIERAFATTLGQYSYLGRPRRLTSGPLTVPADLASSISGVRGIDQSVAKPGALTGAEVSPGAASVNAAAPAPGAPIPPPEGFRNAPPCSIHYGQKSDTVDPPYGGGYPAPLPYAPCGYTPPQLQGAYFLSAPIAAGIDGRGVRVAIVDAYASPTLFADAQQYSAKNQPTQVLAPGQFSTLISKTFTEVELCEASGWYSEQSLDVEAVHATAPGAKILYVGAKNCETGLDEAVQRVVDHHLADIITNSWGLNGGDLLEPPSARQAFDNVLMMAAGTGIGVQASAGDNGDEFKTLGMTVADYPSSSPYITSVGGTSLQVGAGNSRIGELGWSTGKSVLCTPFLEAAQYPGCTNPLLNTWLPPAPGKFVYGGGGGTSYSYPLPWYQQGVVPAALAERNTAITHTINRVEPDISMVGDPSTGMLIGLTQVFPDGVHYGQYRLGGTSLSSPLFAGLMADAAQAAGGPLGFANPLLYRLAAYPSTAAGAFRDIVPAGKQAVVRVDYVNGLNAKEGTLTSVRVLDYEGQEVFCSGSGNCTHQRVALDTAPGFDSMTGIGSPGDGFLAALAKH